MTKVHATDGASGERLSETIRQTSENLFCALPMYPALRLAADVLIEVLKDRENQEDVRVSRAEGKAK